MEREVVTAEAMHAYLLFVSQRVPVEAAKQLRHPRAGDRRAGRAVDDLHGHEG